MARSRHSLAALALLPALACSPGESEREKPPVVLVILDALGAEHVGHLGYERDTTPTLDALAEEGASFTNAFAPAPYTQASIPSILTGLWPGHHGVRRTGDSVAESEVLLAEILVANGYRAFAAVASLNGSSVLGLSQGFESFDEMFRVGPERQRMGKNGKPKPTPTMAATMKRRDELQVVPAEDYLPVVDGWIAALEPGDSPFFYLHILEPHSPYAPPEPFRSKFIDPEYDGPFLGGDNKTLIASIRGDVVAADADIRATRALYDANLAYGDHVLGRIFDKLRAAGLWDDAYVIVTSDHGEAFWQHGIWGHNAHLYDEMVGVPLVVKYPAGEGAVGVRSDALVSPMDVVPSLLSWLDLTPPGELDGVPLDPLGESDPERMLILRSNDDQPSYGLRSAKHKLIVHDFQTGDPRVEFFDLESDPKEQASDPESGEAKNYLWNLRGHVRRFRERGAGATSRELTDEEREHLEALGYVEDE